MKFRSYQYTSKRRFLTYLMITSLIFLLIGNFDKDKKIKKFAFTFFEPFLNISSKVIQTVKQTSWALINFYKFDSENKALRIEVQNLKNKLLENSEIRKENKRLNELLNFKMQLNFNVLPARIIGQNFTNWYDSIIINKGKNDNITIHNAVISPKGIVGKVIEVYEKTSKIMLLSDRNSEVGGLVFRTRDTGIIQGMDKNILMLNYLPRTSDIKPGDVIITSGYNQIFPKGIIIGIVSNVFSDEHDLFKYAEVIPSVNFNQLEEVLIVKEESLSNNE